MGPPLDSLEMNDSVTDPNRTRRLDKKKTLLLKYLCDPRRIAEEKDNALNIDSKENNMWPRSTPHIPSMSPQSLNMQHTKTQPLLFDSQMPYESINQPLRSTQDFKPPNYNSVEDFGINLPLRSLNLSGENSSYSPLNSEFYSPVVKTERESPSDRDTDNVQKFEDYPQHSQFPESLYYNSISDYKPFEDSEQNEACYSNLPTQYIKKEELSPMQGYTNDNSCSAQGSFGDAFCSEYFDDQPLDLTTRKHSLLPNSHLEEDEFSLHKMSPEAGSPYYPLDEETDEENGWLKKIKTGTRSRVRSPKSWEFLLRLLFDPRSNPHMIRWEDRENGTFRLVKKDEIAKIWGMRSTKHKDGGLTYDNFARNLRYHYKTKMLVPVSEKHLVYRFGDEVLDKLRSGTFQIK